MIDIAIGRRELGKTTLAKYLADQSSPRLIIDPRADWPREHAVKDVDEDDIYDRLARGEDVIVQPADINPDSSTQKPRCASIDALARVVEDYLETKPTAGRPIVILFDEAGLYSLASWSYVFRCSPRQTTSIILTAHQPKDIETFVRALSDRVCIFRTIQPHDLKAIQEFCGDDVVEIVRDLQPRQFLAWNNATGESRVYKNAAAWRFPRRLTRARVGSDVSTAAAMERSL